MSVNRLLAIVALIAALLSVFVTGYPLLVIAVVLVAVAMLV
jgi:hypothetical protein